jgi:Holliday junction resolvase RusA-like endonuclease
MTTIRLTLAGIPVAKARPRVTRRGTYTPDKTAQAQEDWGKVFLASGQKPFAAGVPLAMVVRFFLPKPKKTKATELAVKKPDVLNLAMLAADGLEGYAYPNDSQLIWVAANKPFAVTPEEARTELVIWETGA